MRRMRKGMLWNTLCGTGLLLSSVLLSEEALSSTTYTVEAVLAASRCTSVDVSPDRTRLYARVYYAPWDEGFRVFDLTSGNYDVVAEYHVYGIPWQGLASWDNQHLWMTRYSGGYVSALDLNDPYGGFDCNLDVGSWTVGLAFDSLRRYLYVGENCPGPGAIGSIVKVDTLLGSDEGCSEFGRAVLNGEPGRCIRVSYGDQYVFAITRNAGSETLHKIRTSDMQVVGTCPLLGVAGAGFSLSPDGNMAYVAHEDAGQVRVIDTLTMTETESWGLAGIGPEGFFVSPDGTHAIVLAGEPVIRIFDLASETVCQTIPVDGVEGTQGNRYPPYWDCESDTVYVPMNNGSPGGLVVLTEAGSPGDLDADAWKNTYAPALLFALQTYGADTTAASIIALISVPVGGPVSVYLIGLEAFGLAGELILQRVVSDPPDPSYQQIYVPPVIDFQLQELDGLEPHHAALLERSVRLRAMFAANLRAVLVSMERAGGARAAGDDDWVVIHEDAIVEYGHVVQTVIAQLAEAEQAVSDLFLDLGIVTDPLTQQDVESFQQYVASAGLPQEEIEMLSRLDIDAQDAQGIIDEWITLHPDVLIGMTVQDVIVGSVAMWGQMHDVLPEPANYAPLAVPGGPYGGPLGQPVYFDAGNSYDIDGTIVAYQWDWNADGSFDETHTSATTSHAFDASFGGVILVRVTDDDGLHSTVAVDVDTSPPSITCPEDVVAECPGNTSIEANGVAIATDDSGAVEVAYSDDAVLGPEGTQTITRTWVATDVFGNASSCEQVIEVVDTTPPVVTCSVGTDVLWAADHHLVNVGLEVNVSDACDQAGAQASLTVEVWSDETEIPDTGDGTGRHAPDAKDLYAGLRLRKERRGAEDGRVYLIIARAEDACGNVGFGYCAVVVPHDQSQEGLDEATAQADAALATVADTAGATIDEKVALLGYCQHGISEELGPHQ